MTDNKPGFFKRLFGLETPVVQPPAPPEAVPETPAPAPAPVEPPPVPQPAAEPEQAPLPGPPETTPDYVEEIEEQAAAEAPAPTIFVAIDPPAIVEVPVEGPRQSWFARLTTGLKRSSDQLTGSITSVFTKRKLDNATLEELEDILIQADLGMETATAITETLRRDRFDRDVSGDDVRAVLAAEVEKVLEPVARPLVIDASRKPFVILMIGVNGSGKTTTVGKLAQQFADQGKSVMLAAGDTFRAAAIEQLQVWGQRTNATVISRPAGSDASGLAFDAVTQARAEGRDILIIDTAGRLQNREELMGELEKVIRVIKKVDPTAPHATLLTLDATTGQNALKQVEIFGKRAGVTGLVMTKLDGTARGGILVAIAKRFGLPVHFIGVGESVGDLEPFTASEFARAIARTD
ncbi:signal recognition particle-docking protein FtsY [Devosia psychrophila]|uniref:Signal recognition particle receptor FtsY n=1 Tax=Devosia psychrophila TaxID=728005 RepID=A0A0F5PSS3_9HYPH|nr:signal recognition particle-docking protein FtsY [Devosia psychrophila]KKC31693.1 cell division protein FtsY [Devosia psychrophila]SFB92856.1 signal recognition particle-docking protein FtsY [Devosia psychrophila]